VRRRIDAARANRSNTDRGVNQQRDTITGEKRQPCAPNNSDRREEKGQSDRESHAANNNETGAIT
jgi:hypothetical protein